MKARLRGTMPKAKRTAKPYRPYASLVLRGKQLDPQLITEKLGIHPDDSFKRGEQRGTRNKTWPHGAWMMESSAHVKASEPLRHIEWLVEQLTPVRTRLRKVLDDKTIDAELTCFWIMPSPHEEFAMEVELLRALAELEIRLTFDIWEPL